MWIGGAEGAGYRYEVMALVDGYVVQARDLDSGAVETEARIFRTAPVAFAHAQAMAAIDRFAASLLERRDASGERLDAQHSEARFTALKQRFADEGCGWAPTAEPEAPVRTYH